MSNNNEKISAEKRISKAFNRKQELAKEYSVPISAIVWIGADNRFIIIKGSEEIKIEF